MQTDIKISNSNTLPRGMWWIDKPGLIGSINPTHDMLYKLCLLGTDTLISLLEETEQIPRYHSSDLLELGFSIHKIPIRDFTSPTLAQIRQFLEITDNQPSAGKIAVHCKAGSGRTGTMAAAYWISRGLSAEAAIKAVRSNKPSAIETTTQESILKTLEKIL